MAEVSSSSFSEVDGSNTAAVPNGFPEGMNMSGLNDSGRGVMGAVKRFWGRINGRYASAGSSNAYTLTPDQALAAYVTGERYSFRASFANTGSASLNISGLGAKTIKKYTPTGTATLAANDIVSGLPVTVEYDGTDMIAVTPLATSINAASQFSLATLSAVTPAADDYLLLNDTSDSNAAKKATVASLSALTLISAQAASNSSTIDFTGLSSTYDTYLVDIVDLAPDTDSTDLWVRLSEDGSTYQADAGDYEHSRFNISGTPGTAENGSTSDAKIVIGTAIGTGTGETYNGSFTLKNPAGSKYKSLNGSAAYISSSPIHQTMIFGGTYKGSTSAVTAIRFLMSSGNIASGTFRLYGVRK
jgi:hypothetical protein